MQLPANNPWPNPCMAFAAVKHSTYEKFAATNQDLYEMMAPMKDTHQWALAAAVVLEEQMERMGHTTRH